ncbi:MAG: nitronate monooxygenase [Myxococcota bacterium]|jgi:nitronate monooxygenase
MGRRNEWPVSVLTERLGLEIPILQAPMAGAATPQLAAAVSRAGGLGGLGFGGSDTTSASVQIRLARRLGAARLNANFFLHAPPARDSVMEASAVAALAPLARELGVNPEVEPVVPFEPFDSSWLEMLLDARPEVVTFHFAPPPAAIAAALLDAGILIGGTATTVKEARSLESAGCDFVIAQGSEAGGHRGTFEASLEQATIGTFALVPQIVDTVTVPVIAAGGVADGRGFAAALMLGASGVQIGTGFLACPETSVSDRHRDALTHGKSEDVILTRAISGRPARAFRNAVTDAAGSHVAEYPIQFSVTQAVRTAQNESIATEAMWSGQAFPLSHPTSAHEFVTRIAAEARSLLTAL